MNIILISFLLAFWQSEGGQLFLSSKIAESESTAQVLYICKFFSSL
jgi:hypothetical protein